jgi:hypothetical protein
VTLVSEKIVLKWLMVIGGVVEIFLGVAFVFLIVPFLESLGLPTVQLFPQLAGILVANFGFLHIYAAKDVKRFILIPVTSISLRVMGFVIAVYNLYATPALGAVLVAAGSYDMGWALIVLALLKRCNYL